MAEVLHRQGHIKAPVGADGKRLGPLDFLAGRQNCSARVVLLGEGVAPHHHSGKTVLGVGVGRQRRHVRRKASDIALVLFDLFRKVFQQVVLQPVLLALVVGL